MLSLWNRVCRYSFFFFFGAYWLHFKCLTTSCGKGMPELPYRSRRRDVEISGKSTGQYLLASTGSGLWVSTSQEILLGPLTFWYRIHHQSCLLILLSSVPEDLCTFLIPCHGVFSVRANGNLLWKSCAWRKLILTAAGEDSNTHKVKGSRLGCFLIRDVERRRERTTSSECQSRGTGGTRKKQIKMKEGTAG